MATGGFQELADDLECPICMGELDIPKVLQCKHVFCAGCLQKWLHGNKLVCPVCRYEHIFDKKSGVSDLPEPLIISRLQEKITKFLSASQEIGPVSRECGFCKGGATHFCTSCNENLCDTCTKKHTTNKRTKGHITTLVSKWTVCSLHPSKINVGYCVNCKVGLCGLCMNVEHADHEVVDISDETLISGKTSVLENYKKLTTKDLNFNAYKDELNQFMKTLRKQFEEAEARLEKLRSNVNTTIDELKTGLRQHLAAEEKKMVIHKAEIDDIRATRDSLFTFIDDVLQRNSASEIVMAAEDLPDFSENTAPVPPTCKQPEIADYDSIIQSIKDLVRYKRQMSTTIPSTGLSSIVSVAKSPERIKRDDVVPSSPEPVPIPTASLPSTNPWSNPRSVTGGAWGTFVSTSSKTDHAVSAPAGRPLSAGPIGVGARSKKADSTTVPSPQPPVSRRYTQLWEVEPGGNTHDLVWDEKESVWWMRTGIAGLWKFDMGGCLLDRVGQRVLKGWGRICIDTKRGLLVTTDNNTRVVCMRKSGEWFEIMVPGCGTLRGITYCPHRDVYVVTDIDEHCLWFIDSYSYRVVRQLGSHGTGDNQFDWPGFVCHQAINHDTCHIIVSNSNNHCIKVFSSTGEFIRKVGSRGPAVGQLSSPRGVCVDDHGRIIVCDTDNRRVLRYWWDEGEKWEVILNRQQLKGLRPSCVFMTPDGRHLVVGMWSHIFRCYTCRP